LQYSAGRREPKKQSGLVGIFKLNPLAYPDSADGNSNLVMLTWPMDERLVRQYAE
jgi:hypothetical protein